MYCQNCGFNNVEEARICKKCGSPLNQTNNPNSTGNSSTNNRNLIIICITILLILLIAVGTFIFTSNNVNNEENTQSNVPVENNNQNVSLENKSIKVNSVTFYSDGNPNTGETATINVGSEFSGEQIGVMTFYSRDGVSQNSPTSYEMHTVDADGNVVITDYTPMPRYPGHCLIKIKYNDVIYQYECDIGTYKGTQTIVPEEI